MAVRKISPQDVFLAHIMEQRSAAVRKSARDTIREAAEHVQRSEQIVAQSIMAIEKAEKLLERVGRRRERKESP